MMKQRILLSDEESAARRRKGRVTVWRWTIGISIFLLWEICARYKIIDPFYWSRPSEIAVTAYIKTFKGNLISDIIYTSGATLMGFMLGTIGGSALGLSFWWSKTYASVSEPYLVILNALPKLALAPVLVILFGIGFASKVILAFSMTVISSALSAYGGIKSIDKEMEILMYSLGASRWQVFTKVAIPWSLPWMISSLRVNIALALAGAIVGEFIASSHGIGRMIIYAGTTFDIKLVWVGVVILSFLSMLMYGGIVLLERWLSKHLAIIVHD